MIINCKEIADRIELKPKKKTLGIIRYGEHKNAEYFCKSIMDMAEGTDIHIVECDLESYDNKEIAINTIVKVCGKIVCCNPFPEDIKEQLKDLIPPQKDIDNFTSRSRYRNCTAEATRMVLETLYEDIKGLNATVLGANIGWEIARELKDMGATVTICDSHTVGHSHKKQADIIVSAVGKKDLLKKHNINACTTIIDVGNDCESNLYKFAENDMWDINLTPQRNGIGLITTKILLKKVLEG